MILPILFHRNRRYNGGTTYIGSSPRQRHRGFSMGRIGCGGTVLWLLLLAVLAALWSLWYFYPLTADEEKSYRARMVVETRYVVMDDTTEVISFADTRGDTLLAGINDVQRDTVTAYMVNLRDWLPYCGGTFALEVQPDTGSCAQMSPTEVARLLQNEADNVEETRQAMAGQRADVDYFLKTHTVTDDGFSIVERYSRWLTRATDSVKHVAAVIDKAKSRGGLRIQMVRRYVLLGEQNSECEAYEVRDSMQIVRAEGDCDVPMVRMSAKEARLLVGNATDIRPKVQLAHIDSLGTYTGQRDSLRRPHGYGRFMSIHGDFYEGEWKHGKCDGVGFSMIRGKRLQLGEWKENKFLGERITYTPDRIYGIDISRYQHEKGRKRFSINWSNLRITSLGTASRKKIHGAVDYPVSFVYIKATEGMTVKNKYFAADYVASKRSGHRTGAYHFFSVRTPGRNQAINFLRNSRYSSGDLAPALDLEPTDVQIRQAGGLHKLLGEVRAWLQTVERQRGVRPILYISQRFVNKYLPQAPDLMKNYDVWIARYGEYKPNVNLLYWQLCQDGCVSGIHGPVDINVYNGFK